MSATGIVRDNFKSILGLVLAYWAAVTYGYVDAPQIEAPTGWGLVATGGLVVLLGAYYYADEILSLLPDDEGIYVFAFMSHNEAGGQLYELTEDQFKDMRVVNGTLFRWENSPKRVYEVLQYDKERNVAVANWRESVAGSQFAGNATVADAMDFILEIRQEFEPDSERLNRLQRRLRGVARRLDRKRLEDQQQVLDPHYAPAFGEDEATVGDVLQEVIGDDLLPDHMSGEDDERNSSDHNGNSHDEDGEFVDFDILDDTEALDLEGDHEQ